MAYGDACHFIFENDLTTLTRIQAWLVCIASQTSRDLGIFAGDNLQITDYSGDFQESRLNEAKEIVLIAAGTGVL